MECLFFQQWVVHTTLLQVKWRILVLFLVKYNRIEDNRWSVFFVLDDNKELLERAKQLPPSDEYSVVTIPRMKAIYTTFPHRNNSSFFFGPMKV